MANERSDSGGKISGIIAGRFEILEFLGAGGFGELFKARDQRLGRMVEARPWRSPMRRAPDLRCAGVSPARRGLPPRRKNYVS